MKLYQDLLKEYTRQQMGYAPLAIIGQSCIGSAAALLILMNEPDKWPLLFQLFLVTILCMAFNGAILSQQSAKTAFNLLIMSIAMSGFFIIFYIF